MLLVSCILERIANNTHIIAFQPQLTCMKSVDSPFFFYLLDDFGLLQSMRALRGAKLKRRNGMDVKLTQGGKEQP